MEEESDESAKSIVDLGLVSGWVIAILGHWTMNKVRCLITTSLIHDHQCVVNH